MKRFLKGFSLVALVAVTLSLSACDITSLNENPNESANVTTPNLLSAALAGGGNPGDLASTGLASIYWDDYPGAFWVRYAQYWTTNQYTDADRWAFDARRSSSNNANWDDFYLVLNDLQEIVRLSRNSPDEVAPFGLPANQIAIAQIMQVFIFQMMTDMWGPIPYSEALQGRDSGNFSPTYSAQPDIYQGMLDSLTAASNMIVLDEPTLVSGDVVYGGDMSKWKKLANSLKMRVAIRAADQIPEEAAQAISEAIEAGVFESNEDNAVIPFSTAPPYQNPFYENYEVDGRNDWAIPESFLGVMNGVDDPRRASYFTSLEDEGEVFNGFPYGLPGGDAQALFTSGTFYSRPSERVRDEAAAPAFVMFYDEVLFTKAEAAERGFIDGDPAAFYQDAIRASLDYWDAGTDADAYIAGVPYNNSNGWAPADANADGQIWKHTLGIQKWIALYMQGMQGWSEWRRLDFQEVLQIPQGNPGRNGAVAFGCDFPVRMVYPSEEATLNSENRQASVDDMLGGTDTQGVGLWWDIATPSCD